MAKLDGRNGMGKVSPADAVVVMLPNKGLRLTVTDILSDAGERYITVETTGELWAALVGREDAILILDGTAFGVHLQDALKRLDAMPALKAAIMLASQDEMDYFAVVATVKESRCRFIKMDSVDVTLLPVLIKVRAANLRSSETGQEQAPWEHEKGVKLMQNGKKGIFQKELDRRKFLKGAAATAAVAGVVAGSGANLLSLRADAEGEAENVEQVFKGVCRGNCATNCLMNVHVRNGKVVKTSKLDLPLPEFERICQRGLTHNQRIYQPNRLTHPMRRVGERGSGEWEQITWDEAIDEICTKWKSYQKEYGNNSVAYIDGYGCNSVDVDYYKRLFNLMGATHINNAIDRSTIDTFPHTTGFSAWLYGDDPRSMQSAKYIFVWGCNVTESGHVGYAYLQAALDKGAKLIVIDPNYIIAASKAHKYVPIRPATDAVLAMAMTNIVVQKGKIDEDRLMYGTVAPFLVKKSDQRFLRLSDLGRAEAGSAGDAIVVRSVDGTIGLPADIEKPVIKGSFTIEGYEVTTAYDLLLERVAQWTPERAAEICDVPLDTIYELAEMYMEGPSVLYLSLGPDHWGNGPTFYYAATALAMVTGQLGKPGAGVHGASTSLYLGNAASHAHMLMPPGANPGPEIYAPLVPDTVESGKYGDLEINIKSLFIYKHNMLGNQTNRKLWMDTFNKIDLIIVPDMIMNETTKYADIILPVPHFFEVETFVMTYNGIAAHNQKAVEPPGEATGDFEIAELLAKSMGYGDMFTMKRDDFMTEMLNNDNARAAGLDWDNVKKAGYIPMVTADTPIYVNGENYSHATATGRGQFFRENPKPSTDYGQKIDQEREALPYWEPPFEAWTETVGGFERNPLVDRFPLMFMSERPKFRSHTSYAHNPWHNELQPEPTVTFNPIDAEARGIKAGDIVKVYNDRGYVVIKSEINPGNRPGIVMIDHGWVEDEFIEGHYSDLGSNRSNTVMINNAYYDCLVEAEKV